MIKFLYTLIAVLSLTTAYLYGHSAGFEMGYPAGVFDTFYEYIDAKSFLHDWNQENFK